jgi:hypothetical protein
MGMARVQKGQTQRERPQVISREQEPIAKKVATRSKTKKKQRPARHELSTANESSADPAKPTNYRIRRS